MHAIRILSAFVVLTLTVVNCDQIKKRRRHKPIKVRDCGSDPDRPIHLMELSSIPNPAKIPGRVRMTAAFNVTHTLPATLGLEVTISKKLDHKIPQWLPMIKHVKIPCFMHIGSCYYRDVCSILGVYFWNSMCPKKLKKSNIPCYCPFTKGIYRIDNYRLKIPELEWPISMIAEGTFDATVRLIDETSKRELGCIEGTFRLKQRKRLSNRIEYN